MDNQLKQQIDNWTKTDEHDKVIEALENLSPEERDFESIGLLARAYNNVDEYEKALELLESTSEEGAEDPKWNYRIGYSLYYLDRYEESLQHFQKADELNPEDEDTLDFIRYCQVELPFKKRVEDFWEWFTENEPELSRMIENRNEYDPNDMVEFINQGTDLLSESVHFNMGGDYEFTFSVEGETDLFYLYPYVISRMPEQFKDKWHFFPFNQGADETFTFEMYGVKVDMANINIAVTYQEEHNEFDISYYEKGLYSLTEAQSLNAFYIMMEIMLGEGLSHQYIGDVECAENYTDDMITLPELRQHITETLKAHDKQVFDNPHQTYTSYGFEPQENEELRYDVVVGTTCFSGLVAEYYNNETALFDHINQFGAQAAFIAFPFENSGENSRKEALDFRHELEDRLEQDLLTPDGLGLLLGGAVGVDTCYIDLLLFDVPEFKEKIVSILQDYPQYNFYLSDFRQNCGLIRLSPADEDGDC